MTEEETDRLVLAALREIATDGVSHTVDDKAVRLAGPDGPVCVYMRILISVESKAEIEVDLDAYESVVQHYKALLDSIKRLMSEGLVFESRLTEDMYWVTME